MKGAAPWAVAGCARPELLCCYSGSTREDSPMLYNVAQLLKDPVGSVRTYQVHDTLATPGEPWERSQIQGQIQLLRTHRGILATGDFTTSVAATCSRCIEPVEVPLELHLE